MNPMRRLRRRSVTPDSPAIRQIPITENAELEIIRICSIALSDYTLATEGITSQATRGGVVIHAPRSLTSVRPTGQAMAAALRSVGYVVREDFNHVGNLDSDTVVVTGWDPQHYIGTDLTVDRIDDQIDHLLALRRELLDAQSARTNLSPED
ncbi:hypothetical protein ACIBHX_46995 [Nonomuraea sp. NPDC050536]|uniref:hypothetical protein n=1 Tax=Nonomuraea sp. NPDC050536 TaxID=3364366 RepID=UPI0037C62633